MLCTSIQPPDVLLPLHLQLFLPHISASFENLEMEIGTNSSQSGWMQNSNRFTLVRSKASGGRICREKPSDATPLFGVEWRGASWKVFSLNYSWLFSDNGLNYILNLQFTTILSLICVLCSLVFVTLFVHYCSLTNP